MTCAAAATTPRSRVKTTRSRPWLSVRGGGGLAAARRRSPRERRWWAPSGNGWGPASGTAAVAARSRLTHLGLYESSAGGLRFVPPFVGPPPRTATTTSTVPRAGSAAPSPSLPGRTPLSTTPLDQCREPGEAPVVRRTPERRRGAAPLAGRDARRPDARTSPPSAVAGGAGGVSDTGRVGGARGAGGVGGMGRGAGVRGVGSAAGAGHVGRTGGANVTGGVGVRETLAARVAQRAMWAALEERAARAARGPRATRAARGARAARTAPATRRAPESW